MAAREDDSGVDAVESFVGVRGLWRGEELRRI
jgi:hypothetical protein